MRPACGCGFRSNRRRLRDGDRQNVGGHGLDGEAVASGASSIVQCEGLRHLQVVADHRQAFGREGVLVRILADADLMFEQLRGFWWSITWACARQCRRPRRSGH